MKAISSKTGLAFTPLRPLHEEAGIGADEIMKEWKRRRSKWRTSRTLEDGDGEFDPLLEDEDEEAAAAAGMSGSNERKGGNDDAFGGYSLLYIGSLKVKCALFHPFPHYICLSDWQCWRLLRARSRHRPRHLRPEEGAPPGLPQADGARCQNAVKGLGRARAALHISGGGFQKHPYPSKYGC